MKNKGFSILECIFSLLLLSSCVAGVMGIYFNVKNTNSRRLYETSLYTNYQNILRLCEVDPKNSKNIVEEEYKNFIVKSESNYLQIEIYLKVPYKKLDRIIFEVRFNETSTLYITTINVLNIERNYEGINDELLSKRVYKK